MLEQKIFKFLNPVLRDHQAHGTTDATQFSGEQLRNSFGRQIRKYFKYQIFGIILYVKYNQQEKMTFSSKALILFFKKEFSFSESLSLFLMSSYAVTRAKCEATDSSPEYPESGVTVSLLWAFS